MSRELERQRAFAGNERADFFARALAESAAFRRADKARKNVVKHHEMPWEDSPHGLMKHICNEGMDTREYCLDVYQLFLEEGGWSGKHRHLSEEVIYVVEGRGHDLHWDVSFDCQDAYVWDWQEQPSRHEWKEGDFIYIPPYTLHQHFNGDPERPARLICITSRIVKKMGFDWMEQVEESSRRAKREAARADG